MVRFQTGLRTARTPAGSGALPEEYRCAQNPDPEPGDGHRAPPVQRGNGERQHRGDRPEQRPDTHHGPRVGQRGRKGRRIGSGRIGRGRIGDGHCGYLNAVADADFPVVIDITDPADPRVDDFRDLNSADRRPDLPGGKGLVIAEGVLVVARMLASRFAPHALLGTERRLGELAADLAGVTAPFYRASAEVMAEVIGFHLNRGVLAAARRPPQRLVADVIARAHTVAVLEGVNDHENLGSIFRNAAGLGVDAVIFGAGCADPLYRRAVRVSMGHALLVPFARATAWPSELNILRDSGFRLLAMTPDSHAGSLAEAIADVSGRKLAILVGAEGPGLTETVMRAADARVRIPMTAGTDSLNVATAAALAFYERARG